MPAYLNPLIVVIIANLTAITVATIAFSEHIERRARVTAFLALCAIYALWLPTVIWMAAEGVFLASAAATSPVLPLAIVGPPLILLAAIARSPGLRRFSALLSQEWLIGIQGLRVVGLVFVLLWADGEIPWEFALPAGLGDMSVGLIALYTLHRLRQGAANAPAWVRRTNIAGLTDFLVAVATGFFSSPGNFQLLSADSPNAMIQLYPLALIPVFVVPIFICVHILSIRLQRSAKAATADQALSM